MEAKGAIERWLRRFQITRFEWQAPDDSLRLPAFLHPGQSASLSSREENSSGLSVASSHDSGVIENPRTRQ